MNTKHTPGPWKYIAWHGQHGVHDAMDNDVCETFGEDAEANARLIAAAPELLEALMRLDAYHSLMVSSVDRQAIRDAIAKATQP